MKVGFMHRTVFEFLRDERVWKLDCLRMEADSKFDAATDLSLIRLHLAMHSLHEHSPRDAQALECLRDGVRWGSKADRDHPLSRENIFWKMMPFLDLLHARGIVETRFSIRNHSLFKLARAHTENPVGRFSHATLALAADAGAVNYLKEHPCLLKVAEDCEPIRGFQPLFFDTIHRVSLLGLNWNRLSSSPPWLRAYSSDAVVRLLLSAGCDPNKFVSDGRGIIIYSPWALWLERKHDNLGTTIQEKLVALTTIESFVAAGATTRPDVWFDVETWIKESFGEPELIERSQSVLQSFRELKTTDLVVGARRKRADSDELGVRGPEMKRVCPC